MRTLRLTGGTTRDQGRNEEEGEGTTDSRVWTPLTQCKRGSKVDIKIRRWEGVRGGEIGGCSLLQAHGHGGLESL